MKLISYFVERYTSGTAQRRELNNSRRLEKWWKRVPFRPRWVKFYLPTTTDTSHVKSQKETEFLTNLDNF